MCYRYLTTCGNVAASVWVAAQRALTILLIVHLVENKGQSTQHNQADNITHFIIAKGKKSRRLL